MLFGSTNGDDGTPLAIDGSYICSVKVASAEGRRRVGLQKQFQARWWVAQAPEAETPASVAREVRQP